MVRKIDGSPLWANRRVQRRIADQSRETEKCNSGFRSHSEWFDARKTGVSPCAAIASWHRPKFTNSGRGAVIVAQHAAQALAPLDHARVSQLARFAADESVR